MFLADRRLGMTKLTVAFRNFAKALKNDLTINSEVLDKLKTRLLVQSALNTQANTNSFYIIAY